MKSGWEGQDKRSPDFKLRSSTARKHLLLDALQPEIASYFPHLFKSQLQMSISALFSFKQFSSSISIFDPLNTDPPLVVLLVIYKTIKTANYQLRSKGLKTLCSSGCSPLPLPDPTNYSALGFHLFYCQSYLFCCTFL